MLKWLVNVYGQEGEGATQITDKITEDPLATIRLGKKKKTDQIYSVNRLVFFCSVNDTNFFYSTSRFNPLFEEEAVIETNISKDVTDDQETISTTSSGYGSNTTHKGELIFLNRIILKNGDLKSSNDIYLKCGHSIQFRKDD